MKGFLLLVNQDKRELARWGEKLREWGIPFREMRDAFAALELLQLEPASAVICRSDLPLFSGFELGRRIKRIQPGVGVALAEGGDRGQPPRPVDLSAADIGPVVMDDRKLVEVVGELLLAAGLLLEEESRRYLCLRPGFAEIAGRSRSVRETFSLIDKVSDQEVTVLVEGESGTGKELVAQAIHRHSRRVDKPYVSVNCAALSETLLESELFGHEKGAFTGASARTIGRFEQADQGCLFLDEIGDMSPATQAKVLRVLEGHEFERVGGREGIKVDVRIIAATNRDLKKRVVEGRFREDLFYRIGAFPIHLPALRERLEDVPLLVAHIIHQFNRQSPKKIKSITLSAVNRLLGYGWPGNIRELENTISRAAILADGGMIDREHILLEERPPRPAAAAPAVPAETGVRPLSEVEKDAIREALERFNMNVSQAAKGLGISRATLYKKAREYGIPINRPK